MHSTEHQSSPSPLPRRTLGMIVFGFPIAISVVADLLTIISEGGVLLS